MRRIIGFILVVAATLFSCTNPKANDAGVKKTDTVAVEEAIEIKPPEIKPTDEEKAIIGNMDCWKAIFNVSWSYFNKLTYVGEGDRDERIQKSIKQAEKETKEQIQKEAKSRADASGRNSLHNDVTFINIIRNDSLYNALLEERKGISKSLFIYKNKVPFFKEFIDKISKNIIEYNHYGIFCRLESIVYIHEKKAIYHFDYIVTQTHKIYEYPIKGTSKQFYENYSDLLKEGYKGLPENSNVKDEDIKNLNDILKSLEKLDKALWAVKYYEISKNKWEKENKTKQRTKQIDELFE